MKHGKHGSPKNHSHPAPAGGGEGKDRHLHNPIEDRLIPLEPLDLGKVKSIDGLVRAMAKTAFTGRQLGEAADVQSFAFEKTACFNVSVAGFRTVGPYAEDDNVLP